MINLNNKIELSRPSWTDWFLTLAIIAARRSPDGQTKHGAIIANKHNQILSSGFNGFPSGMKDYELPNLRPDKYYFVGPLHAEVNAILNSTNSKLKGSYVYVTGKPCNNCLFVMNQKRIKKVFYADLPGGQNLTENNEEVKQIFLQQTKIKLYPVKPDWEIWKLLATEFYGKDILLKMKNL